jgi:rSAM/selenodomain-associated transferase 1
MPDACVAILAKAPIAGYAKTRLIPRLGPDGAARLQERLIERAVATALDARLGPVTLWCAPDDRHPVFRAVVRPGITLATQPEGDLGERMLTAFRAVRNGCPLVLIGTDCPALTPSDLVEAATLLATADVVISPAEDGGYGLIAAERAIAELFERMPWGSGEVAALTRVRAAAVGLVLSEMPTIWDVDSPSDFDRLARSGLLAGATELL